MSNKTMDLTDLFGFPAEISYDEDTAKSYIRFPTRSSWSVYHSKVNNGNMAFDYTDNGALAGVEIFIDPEQDVEE